MKDLRAYLKDNILIFDGAMGTYFQWKYKDYKSTCEEAALSSPEYIKEIHREYLKAGACAIKTDTFSVTPMINTDPDRSADIIRAAYGAATEAAAEHDAFVFADIGPLGGTDEDRRADLFKKTADVFLECGAENFLFETNSSAAGLAEAASYIKSVKPEAYIIVSFAVQPDGCTREGLFFDRAVKTVRDSGAVDAVGMNCVSSALHMKELLENYAPDIPEDISLSVMPNAGYPKVLGTRTFYDSDPAYYAEQTSAMKGLGAGIIGGCCGTTPEHIRLLAEALRSPDRAESYSGVITRERKITYKTGSSGANRFHEKLSAGRKVIACELDPPRNADAAKFMSGAWALKAAGIDAMTIADCATARASMDSSIMACKVHRELGMDVIPHLTCRDRNLNATKALLLGLATEGVHNVLTVTGDPVPSEEKDEVKSVYQFNSRKLASYITSLNEKELTEPFVVYGALNLNARNFEKELSRAVDKVKCGMTGFLTQPVLCRSAEENLRTAYGILDPMGAKVLGGILPVVSERNARYMNSEINGITVDREIAEKYAGKTRSQCTELAVSISTDIAGRIASCCHGYYLITPFSRTDIMTAVIGNIKDF